MNTTGFASFHPVGMFLYFASVITLVFILSNPVFLVIGIFPALLLTVFSGQLRQMKNTLFFALPVILLIVIISVLTNNRGVTVLFSLNDFRITLEAVVYSLMSGMTLLIMMIWFANLNSYLTDNKLLYLFSNFTPTLSVLIVFVLRFIPLFSQRLREIRQTQKTLCMDISRGKLTVRLRNTFNILSVLLEWSLEESLETAQSMRARGFGLAKRTSIISFKFKNKDYIFIILNLLFIIFTLIGWYNGEFKAVSQSFLPPLSFTPKAVATYLSYLFLGFMPLAVELNDELKWKQIKGLNSKGEKYVG